MSVRRNVRAGRKLQSVKNLTRAFAALAAGAVFPNIAAAQSGCAALTGDARAFPHHHHAGVAALDRLAPKDAGAKAVRSGRWSDPQTWGGATPNGRVVIPAGIDVIFDKANSRDFESVRVDGCLEMADDRSTRLNAELVYVAPGGSFAVGALDKPLRPDVTAEIAILPRGPIDVSRDPTLVGRGFVSASRVSIHGARKSSRVRFAKPPRKGDRTLTLAGAPRGWRVGDRIVVTGTRFKPILFRGQSVVRNATEDEVRLVTSVSGSTVSLNEPLKYDHVAPTSLVAGYAVNYSRNVRILTKSYIDAPVSQRGHTMFMSPEIRIDGVEFYQLGRTDKSRRAVSASSLSNPTPTANVKGRYPFHIHRTGLVPDDQAPTLVNNVVWGSPGWGFTQHDAKAFFYDNATYDAFGAGFVTESGTETGAWIGNTAIRSRGVVNESVKDAASVAAFDLGRSGNGFWLQGRLVRVQRNVAAGMTGDFGFVYMHRGVDPALGTQRAITPAHLGGLADLAMWRNHLVSTPPLAAFRDNEVFASKGGFYVSKSRTNQHHDARNVIENFTAWAVQTGMEITYTNRVTAKNVRIWGVSGDPLSTAIEFGRHTYDVVFNNLDVRNAAYGIDIGTAPQEIARANHYTFVNLHTQNIARSTFKNAKGDETVLSVAPPRRNAVSVDFKGSDGAAPRWSLASPLNRLYLDGEKTDALGAIDFPVGVREFNFGTEAMAALLMERGYFETRTGGKVAVAPQFVADRMTGAIDQIPLVIDLVDPVHVDRATGFLPAPAANRGVYNPQARKPYAAADSISVAPGREGSVNVTANDRVFVGARTMAGFSQGAKGVVRERADGRLAYRPLPGYRGRDQFTYWIRDGQDNFARGVVVVDIQ